VYNEFQRQFAMPGRHETIVDEYLAYTYPYRTAERIADIKSEICQRRLDGLVHYVQSFCFRQLADKMIRRAAGVPVLALEFDRPGRLDARSLTRVDAFVELLEGHRSRRAMRGGK
jgi:benzoyl-CoA reductase/2-hydroxyglutaryl-CoA dehydratase subunit BcrC/BadD/HgdB